MKSIKTKSGESKNKRVSKKVRIVAIRRDMETNKVTLTIEYTYQGQDYTTIIARGMLTKRNFPQLLDIGVDVTESNVLDIIEFLRLQEQGISVTVNHSTLGFSAWQGKTVFKHHQAIGCESTYSGPLRIEPKGSYEVWLSLIQAEVIGNIPMEAALTIGLAAPLASLIGRVTGLEVLLFHLYGDSSKGKTTAIRVSVSPFGYPHTQEGGLIHTWNGTQNAILAPLRNNHGVPMAFDEASMLSRDFTNLIYMLASGQDKARLTKEAELRDQAQWSGCLLSTAEHSLFAKSNQNVGIQMRLFEIGNVTWTRSAQNADALKEGLMQNYGHAGPMFVKYLMSLGTEALVERWRRWQQTILQELDSTDPFSSRLADKVAVLVATAELANESLMLGLNVASIQNMLTDTVTNSGEGRDLATKAYEVFQETLARYEANFAADSQEFTPRELWGKIIEPQGTRPRQVFILPNVFREWMDDAGFEDVNVVLGLWRERGWLDCSDDKHLTRQKAVRPGSQVRVYVVKLPSNADLLNQSILNSRKRKIGIPATSPPTGGAHQLLDSE